MKMSAAIHWLIAGMNVPNALAICVPFSTAMAVRICKRQSPEHGLPADGPPVVRQQKRNRKNPYEADQRRKTLHSLLPSLPYFLMRPIGLRIMRDRERAG